MQFLHVLLSEPFNSKYCAQYTNIQHTTLNLRNTFSYLIWLSVWTVTNQSRFIFLNAIIGWSRNFVWMLTDLRYFRHAWSRKKYRCNSLPLSDCITKNNRVKFQKLLKFQGELNYFETIETRVDEYLIHILGFGA